MHDALWTGEYHFLDDLTVLRYRSRTETCRGAIGKAWSPTPRDRFSIVGKKDLYPNQLSGGQQQLVAVARAVIANPTVLLADEPTGNLHSAQGQEIMDLFKALNAAGTTIIQVTHSELNASYGSRVITLRDGWMQ